MPCPPPGDLSDPGIKPTSLASPAWSGRFFTTEPPEKPQLTQCEYVNYISINLEGGKKGTLALDLNSDSLSVCLCAWLYV